MADNKKAVVSGDSYIRAHLKNMGSYTAILPFEVLSVQLGRKPEEIIKLDANENPYGPPPEVSKALGALKFPHVYPDAECRQLRAGLESYIGLESQHLIVGCGAYELLDLIMRCVLDPNDKIVDCPPTFPMYQFGTTLHAGQVIEVPRKPDFSLDLERISEAVSKDKPKCIILASPNNPDGSLVTDEALLRILELPILVVLDEAYIEFSGMESRIKWVKKHENLIVLRTFSKVAGLAGLRVGYGAFPLSMIDYFRKAKQPFSASVAAQAAACAALQNASYLEKVKNALIKERRRMYELLKGVPFLKPFPSYANFLLCEVAPGKGAKQLKDELARMGIVIRYYGDLNTFVRITVGKPEHTDALMECLRRLAN
ncbi:histidinol-phosphate aminotransferase, chloroplastic-like [Diospyros lotus]|uniref:histidinol-phosphate aminotransferase, chloroplastic-like n=1 Tax=Diospyros lotus TaxID=55363 RepID=UPI00225BE8B9|nr:histidinol-phosphate aminotransferase, chloroplastic-like [Diospyros lotus]